MFSRNPRPGAIFLGAVSATLCLLTLPGTGSAHAEPSPTPLLEPGLGAKLIELKSNLASLSSALGDTLAPLAQSRKDSDTTAIYLMEDILLKEGTRSPAELKAIAEWRNTLAPTQKANLHRLISMDAPTRIQTDFNMHLMQGAFLPDEVYPSAMFYMTKNSLENLFEGKSSSKVWIEKHPFNPGILYVFAQRPETGKSSQVSLRPAGLMALERGGVEVWMLSGADSLKAPLKFKVAGQEYTLRADLPKPLTEERVDELISRLLEGQKKVDYSKVCKDRRLKTVFAFGQDEEASITQLSWELGNDKWKRLQSTKTKDLKSAFLKESGEADYVVKEAHAGGAAGIFRMGAAGEVVRYTRVLPRDSGIYKRCPELKEITEEVVVITPNQDAAAVQVKHVEMCSALASSAPTNGGQTVFYDGSCFSTDNVANLYCEYIRKMDCNEGMCLATFHSKDMQFGKRYQDGKGIRWSFFKALRNGQDFDDVNAMKHDENKAKVTAPGARAEEDQEWIFRHVKRLLTNPVGFGKVHLKAAGSKEEQEF